MDQIDEQAERQDKVFKNMQVHTDEVMEELSKLKDTYKLQSDAFVGEVRKLDETIIGHAERLTEYC